MEILFCRRCGVEIGERVWQRGPIKKFCINCNKKIAIEKSKVWYEKNRERAWENVRKWQRKNKERVEKFKKKYRGKPERKEKMRIYYKNWYKTNGRKRNPGYLEIIKEWEMNNPEKVKASAIVNYAIKEGKIKKPKNCERCGLELKLNGHHPNYNQPFNVVWLCASCHKIIHNESKKT